MSELSFSPSHRWCAQWIWTQDEGTEPNVYILARREFTLATVPKEAVLRLTADSRYRLWINGTMIGSGPPQSQPYAKYYDVLEVAEHLVAGANCLALVVQYTGAMACTRGGLLVELEADGDTVVASGDGWKLSRGHAWKENTFLVDMNKAVPYQEYYDSRHEPEGWREVGFDDERWGYARVIGRPPTGPWTCLIPRDIPAMKLTGLYPSLVVHTDESRAVVHRGSTFDLSRALSTAGRSRRVTRCDNPEHLCKKGAGAAILMCSTEHLQRRHTGAFDPAITFDFGRQTTAYLELEVEGPAGAIIDIGYAERLTDGRFVNAIEGQFANRFILKGGRQTFRSFGWIGFRYLKVRLREAYEPTTIHRLQAIETVYPFKRVGKFASPDDKLNSIYDLSRATILLCSNECITDTPWREQAQWLGDVSAVTLGGIYACFGDTQLTGKFIRQSAANQLPTGLIANCTNLVSIEWNSAIPDFSLWWVEALWHHYLYTGDASWIQRYYATACRVVHAFLPHIDADGIIDRMPGWVFIDWAHIKKDGASCPLNAIFYHVMGILGKMAALQQDRATSELLESTRERMRASFHGRFFDAEQGCYVDCEDGGMRSSRVSEHGNMMAILADLADRETTASIIDRLYVARSTAMTIAEPFFTWQVLKGLDRAGRFDLALAVLRERWGWMLENGQTTCSEEWSKFGSWRQGDDLLAILRSESHAWSACPAEFLTRTLPGIEVLEPGWTRVRLSPHVEEVPTFCVHVPTPLGKLVVTAEHGEVTWKAPKGMTVHLSSPEATAAIERG